MRENGPLPYCLANTYSNNLAHKDYYLQYVINTIKKICLFKKNSPSTTSLKTLLFSDFKIGETTAYFEINVIKKKYSESENIY